MKTNGDTGAGSLARYFDMSFMLYVFAGLILTGGAVLGVALWPEKVVFGYEWAPVAYLPSAGALTFGTLQGAMLAALGKGLHYLSRIAENTAK